MQPGRPGAAARGVLVALVVSGCAAQNIRVQDEAIAERMQAAPDVGDDEVKLREKIQDIERWRDRTRYSHDLPAHVKPRMDADFDRLRMTFVLKAAEKTSTPGLAFEFATHAWSHNKRAPIPAEIRQAFHKYAAGATDYLQKEHFPKHHTYARDRAGKPPPPPDWMGDAAELRKWKEESEAVVMNCVLASRPFGEEPAGNAALAHAFAGDGPIHARCYLQYPIELGPNRLKDTHYEFRAFVSPAYDGKSSVDWSWDEPGAPFDETSVAAPEYMDFTIDSERLKSAVSTGGPFVIVLMTAATFGGGHVEEQFSDGRYLREIPLDLTYTKLAFGKFFWEPRPTDAAQLR